MTPFGTKIKLLRTTKKKRQKAVAVELGVLPCHLFQIERGSKGPFPLEVRAKFKDALELTESEADGLEILAAISNRTFRLPEFATAADFHMTSLLARREPNNKKYRIEIARVALTDDKVTLPIESTSEGRCPK